ncbi:alpha-ketoglutarate-dependent dioxygenase AlkB [Antarcticibacterium arcticum]|uniref:Alpha-ketoglutarate-dependent dioxygenase AlkB n=1 Tax=Antarcticibacterium arcticum TaxID=2585771 RepID=A0A5B8YKD2_9FLAO|nr:alpha-ketoglutarate-dependent dioxygenase AlkB [Antarcticibacterium arcticum]QED37638.1 alpha-ketoglutarate-dependent dioxygenase AlkB [Antarcticibacterium arcticum]
MGTRLNLPDSDIIYFPNFLEKENADAYLDTLLENLNWQQHSIKIFGKTIPQPRLTALYAETETPYTYSGLTLLPKKFTCELLELKKELKKYTPTHFTHCLANLYRNGKDSMGLHSDNEKELGKDPVIASVSLGATRKFILKHRHDKDQKHEIALEHGSLLLMMGATQHFWKHELPKTKLVTEPRINLTFRKIISSVK